jgi:hypothetical protein
MVFYGQFLVYFVSIWFILKPFGIYFGRLVSFLPILLSMITKATGNQFYRLVFVIFNHVKFE